MDSSPRRGPGRPRTGRGTATRVVVAVTLTPEEGERLDAARGDEARAVYARGLVLAGLVRAKRKA